MSPGPPDGDLGRGVRFGCAFAGVFYAVVAACTCAGWYFTR
jgi:hypothetical protein